MSLWVPVGVILPRLSPSLDSSMPDWREGGRDCRLLGVTPDEFDEPYCYWEASYYCNSPLSIKTTKLLSPGFVSAIPSAFVTIDFDTLSVLGVDLSKFSSSLRFWVFFLASFCRAELIWCKLCIRVCLTVESRKSITLNFYLFALPAIGLAAIDYAPELSLFFPYAATCFCFFKPPLPFVSSSLLCDSNSKRLSASVAARCSKFSFFIS